MLDYANYTRICLLSHKWSDMQEKLNDWNYESKKIGLHINLAKTDEMGINNKPNNTIILENETIRKWQILPTSVVMFLKKEESLKT
jgi:hypothetical protein